MRHRTAKGHLSQLLDRTLPGPLELSVRAHAERCDRCSRRLAELELCDQLVARLPFGVVPLDASSEERLAGLARWALEPPSPLRGRLEGLALAAAAAAMAGVVALAGASQWVPSTERTGSGVIQIAYVIPASARAR